MIQGQSSPNPSRGHDRYSEFDSGVLPVGVLWLKEDTFTNVVIRKQYQVQSTPKVRADSCACTKVRNSS